MITIPIRARLAEDATIRHHADDAVVVGSLPQDFSRPAVAVNQITCTPLDEISGLPVCDVTIIQIDIWADKIADSLTVLKELGNAVRTLLEGQRWQADGYSFQGAKLQRDNITEQPPFRGSDEWLHRRSMDFQITHTNLR